MEDSTISGNTSAASSPDGSYGGGIYVEGPLTLAADIVAKQKVGPDCEEVSSGTKITDAGYNIDDDGTCGFSSSNGSVSDSGVIGDYLGTLSDNGGPTETMPLLATPSPTTSSPDPAFEVIPSTFDLPVAVNGVSLACSVPDQRGDSRTAPCDMGAYQSISKVSTTTTLAPSANPTTIGTNVTYTATVSVNSPASRSPSGTVAFTSGGTTIGTCSAVTLSAGQATCTTQYAAAGPQGPIVATYSGDTGFEGSVSSPLTEKVVADSSPQPPAPAPAPPAPPASPPTHGYWLVGSDGGIFTFGSAQFYGSTGSLHLQRPVVGIVPTADRGGYWLDASDGGVFSFGDTQFFGSIPGLGLHPAGSGLPNSLNAPIVGMVPSNDDRGYFMVASDGGVFAFGDAHFAGSCPGIGGCSGAAVAVMPDHSGDGYWVVTNTGSVYTFGDAPYFGAPGHGNGHLRGGNPRREGLLDPVERRRGVRLRRRGKPRLAALGQLLWPRCGDRNIRDHGWWGLLGFLGPGRRLQLRGRRRTTAVCLGRI